jgi:NitT/TauT family transport system permease protein
MTSTSQVELNAAREVVDRVVSSGRSAPAWRAGTALRRVVNVSWPLVLVLAAWSLWVAVGDVPPAVAPQPSDVVSYLGGHLGSFVGDTWRTVEVVIGGVVIGTVAGVLLAALSWFSEVVRAIVSGPALLTQCLPVATITPVLARVFGYGTATMVVITALISFFPVLVFATAGLRRTPPGSEDLFIVLGAGVWQRFWRLAAPAAVPRVLVALRVSVVAAVAGTMLAQWIMGTTGLGSRLIVAQASFRTAEAWAASVVSIVLSVLLYSAVSAFSRRAGARFD